MLYPNHTLTELAIHLPPLAVQLEMLTVKFFCKVFTVNDNITATLFQVDGSLSTAFHPQLAAIKKFIAWKCPHLYKRRIHHIELCSVRNRDKWYYDQAAMLQYQQKVWCKYITNTIDSTHYSTRTNKMLINITDKLNVN